MPLKAPHSSLYAFKSMTAKNSLTQSPPFPVEKALKLLGANLRLARVRRGFTIQHVAEKIGTGVRAVGDAERGKVSTSISVYVALLWLYGLMADFELVADPARDAEGSLLARRKEPTRARPGVLDNDF